MLVPLETTLNPNRTPEATFDSQIPTNNISSSSEDIQKSEKVQKIYIFEAINSLQLHIWLDKNQKSLMCK